MGKYHSDVKAKVKAYTLEHCVGYGSHVWRANSSGETVATGNKWQ